MRTTLQNVKPSDLVHVSNVRDVSRTASNTTDPDLRDLVNSVRTFGVLQPITVRKVGGKLNIVYGHRRALAALLAELPTVPVYVEQVPDEEIVARQLVENLQRSNLSLAETAKGVRALFDEYRTARMVGEMLGKSAAWVSKMLALTSDANGRVALDLVARDVITDLEMAYDLTTYEKRTDFHTANTAGREIEGGTLNRAGLRKLIDGLKEPTPDDEDDGDAQPVKGKSAPGGLTLYLTADEVSVLRKALAAYMPVGPDLVHALNLRNMANSRDVSAE